MSYETTWAQRGRMPFIFMHYNFQNQTSSKTNEAKLVSNAIIINDSDCVYRSLTQG